MPEIIGVFGRVCPPVISVSLPFGGFDSKIYGLPHSQIPRMCFSLLFLRITCAPRTTCSKVLFVAYAMRGKHSWRIRLAAYGARLERVLG